MGNKEMCAMWLEMLLEQRYAPVLAVTIRFILSFPLAFSRTLSLPYSYFSFSIANSWKTSPSPSSLISFTSKFHLTGELHCS